MGGCIYSDPADIIRSIIDVCKTLQDPERSTSQVLRTLSHISAFLTSLRLRISSKSGARISDSMSVAVAREDAIFGLALIEKLTDAVSSAVSVWGRGDAVGGFHEGAKGKQRKMAELASSVVRVVETVGGIPLHVSFGAHASSSGKGKKGRPEMTQFFDADTNRSSLPLASAEIENLRSLVR